MGGTVALRSVKKKFQESYSSAANGVVAISQKYQNLKNLEKATLSQLVHVVYSHCSVEQIFVSGKLVTFQTFAFELVAFYCSIH